METKIIVRGKFLYLEYVEFGKRVRKSTGLKDTRANIAYIHRNIIPDIERKQKLGIGNQKQKLSYFLEKVIQKTELEKKINTIAIYKFGAKCFLDRLGDRDVDTYTISEIENFINEFSPKTARTYLIPVSLAFNIAVKYEIISRNPCSFADKPKIKPKERTVFDKDSVKSILAHAQGELKTFLYIAFYTGARAGEILALRWDDIGDHDIAISKTYAKGIINSPKNGKSRRVILLEPLKDYLNNLPHEEAFIFKSDYQRIFRLFKILQVKLGLKPQGLHITRHTYASLLINANIKPSLAQEMLGHSSLMMTNLYTHYLKSQSDKLELEKALF